MNDKKILDYSALRTDEYISIEEYSKVIENVSIALISSLEIELMSTYNVDFEQLNDVEHPEFFRKIGQNVEIAVEKLILMDISIFFKELSYLDISFYFNNAKSIDNSILIDYYNNSKSEIKVQINDLVSRSNFQLSSVLEILLFINCLNGSLELVEQDKNKQFNNNLTSEFVKNKLLIYNNSENAVLADISEYAVLNLFNIIDLETSIIMLSYFKTVQELVRSLSNSYFLNK